MDLVEKNIKAIEQKLIRFENRRLLLGAAKKYVVSFKWFLIVILFLVLAESILNFAPSVRTSIFLSILILFVTFQIFPWGELLLKKLYQADFIAIAERTGEVVPEIGDQIANVLQINNENNINYSSEMIDKATENLWLKINDIELYEYVSKKEIVKAFQNLAVTGLITILFLLVVPGQLNALDRIINYKVNYKTEPKIVFTVGPGNSEIPKGKDIKISCEITGSNPEEILLYKKSEEQAAFEKLVLTADSLGRFTSVIKNNRTSFVYYFKLGNKESEKFNIGVIEYPFVKSFELEVIPPRYSSQPASYYLNNGNIKTLYGSKIKIAVELNKPLKNAAMITNSNKEVQMIVKANKAHLNIVANQNYNFHFELEDSSGYANIAPVEYEINILQDEYPEIKINEPEKIVKLGKNNWLRLLANISDDFGFNKLNLRYKISSSIYLKPENNFRLSKLEVPKGVKEAEVVYIWNLDTLTLAAGDEITYYLEVFDNDNISGPKKARTENFIIKVPTIDEILDEAETTANIAENALKETYNKADELKNEIEKLDNELKKDDKTISWDEKQKIENALDKYEKLLDEAEKINKDMAEVKNKLNENDLLSQETLDKYMELQELFEKLDNEKIREAFQEMNNLLQKLNRSDIQDKLGEIKFNEEQFRNSIERTMNLIKRMQVEQKLDELVKRAEVLEDKQETVQKGLDKPNPNNGELNRLQEQQNSISEDLNNIEDNVADLLEKMKGLQQMPIEEAANLQKELQKQNNNELSENVINEINKKNFSEARNLQSQISENMKTAKQKLQSMREQMQQANKMEIFYGLIRVMKNILEISAEEEEILATSTKAQASSPIFKDLSDKQNILGQNLSSIFAQMNKLGNKSFSITPEMGKALGRAKFEIEKSTRLLFDGDKNNSIKAEQNALANLNESALLISKMLELMMSGEGAGSGSGMSMMQQMQQLSQQQMNLNMLTQKMQAGQLSQQQMAQVQRLAAQQEVIRKSLDQLNRESKEEGQSKSMAANLDKILSEMQEVISGMNTSRLDDALIKKQEHILSKMLDAQKSLNERDFEEQRKSCEGIDVKRSSPEELMKTEYGRNLLREELMKAIKEGYSKDYEDLIRKYFKALEKKTIEE